MAPIGSGAAPTRDTPKANVGGAVEPKSPSVTLSGTALVSAIVVLLAFGVLIAFLASQVAAPETAWTRLAWLFTSVEAIAFGAAGALFGSNIQRQRAERAEEAAQQNSTAAARGHALAATIKADDLATHENAGEERLGGRGVDPRSASASVAARHAAIARELFP
jgi:hypothetical protein